MQAGVFRRCVSRAGRCRGEGQSHSCGWSLLILYGIPSRLHSGTEGTHVISFAAGHVQTEALVVVATFRFRNGDELRSAGNEWLDIIDGLNERLQWSLGIAGLIAAYDDTDAITRDSADSMGRHLEDAKQLVQRFVVALGEPEISEKHKYSA